MDSATKVLQGLPAASLWERIVLPANVTLDERDLCDLEMLLSGAFSPLKGYLTHRDFCSVVDKARLSDGTVWPLPIILPIPKSSIVSSENLAEAVAIEGKEKVIHLRDTLGTVVGVVEVEDCYVPDLDVVALNVLGSIDPAHPYLRYLRTRYNGNFACVGGKVTAMHGILHFDFPEYRKSPKEVRKMIKDNKWDVVVGFQTRNPLHRSHFELTRACLAKVEKLTGKTPHLLLMPACGPTQPNDIAMNIRVRCYRKILPYYESESVVKDGAKLVLLPLAMRMAGPREAILHAIIRKNYGCTHFIVGRDHAGPSVRRASDGKPFYAPYDAQKALEAVAKYIGIVPVFGSNMVYLGEEHGYVEEDAIPTLKEKLKERGGEIIPELKEQQISGTELRRLLMNREPLPHWYSFPPIIEELQRAFKPRKEQGFCVYFTGLPCSGKSTLANALEAALQSIEAETRKVTVFDADIIRLHLSRGLGFSRQDRSANVRRIGYVASLVVQHGGICIVANIAPYEEDRVYNRNLVKEAGGGYIEAYVSTPLDICENRDIKHLYRNARLGIIKQFTGISDPYEIPEAPELVIDTSRDIPHTVEQVLKYLKANQWIGN